VLETFMRALPHTYRHMEVPAETRIKITITGEAGGSWGLKRADKQWVITPSQDMANDTEITMTQDTAWKLFTKGLSGDEAARSVTIEGDASMGEPILSTVAVMA
jgi:hypothetical protein